MLQLKTIALQNSYGDDPSPLEHAAGTVLDIVKLEARTFGTALDTSVDHLDELNALLKSGGVIPEQQPTSKALVDADQRAQDSERISFWKDLLAQSYTLDIHDSSLPRDSSVAPSSSTSGDTSSENSLSRSAQGASSSDRQSGSPTHEGHELEHVVHSSSFAASAQGAKAKVSTTRLIKAKSQKRPRHDWPAEDREVLLRVTKPERVGQEDLSDEDFLKIRKTFRNRFRNLGGRILLLKKLATIPHSEGLRRVIARYLQTPPRDQRKELKLKRLMKLKANDPQ